MSSIRWRAALATVGLLLSQQAAPAQVRIVTGPTPIAGGDARAAGDLTVINDRLAFALAVTSPVPYGVPRGALIDIAPVVGGKIGRDRVVFADFIPNDWSAWPNTYQRIEILSKGPAEARIRTVRDFSNVVVTTTYVLSAHSDRVELSTTLLNKGGTRLSGLLSGLTLWPSSGYLFSVPGMAGVKEGESRAALAHRVSAYDRDWTVTLHAPYFDRVGSSSRDLFLLHDLKPGQSRTFGGWLQVGARGDLAPVVGAEIEQAHLASGAVHGRVSSRAGAPVADAVVVIEKEGKPYAWALAEQGKYRISLPAGEYGLYGTGRNHSRSAAMPLSVRGDSDQVRDIHDLEAPGRIEFSVLDAAKRTPLDARIVISEGEKPVIEFLGRTTFFTELERKGHATIPVAPGRYTFSLSSGAGVLGRDAQAAVRVRSGAVADLQVSIERRFDPTARGWYAADLHHHADQAEAVTPAKDLARSQLAAGLDVLFVSDHDSTVNHGLIEQLAAARGVPFIPGIELSPSWGHFNAYPLKPGAQLAIDTGTAPVHEVFREARRMGATIVQVNHPFIPYGYLSSVEKGVASGGFDPGFDLMEINSANQGDDAKVLARLAQLWNAGKRYYLTAGSDTHDVWNEQSGLVRIFAHIDGPPAVAAFARALKQGHAYVSFGPLVFPSVMFGTELAASSGAPVKLAFEVASAAGVKQVDLIAEGKVAESRAFADAPLETRVEFVVRSTGASWRALRIEDAAGRRAYTNPIWISAGAQGLRGSQGLQ